MLVKVFHDNMYIYSLWYIILQGTVKTLFSFQWCTCIIYLYVRHMYIHVGNCMYWWAFLSDLLSTHLSLNKGIKLCKLKNEKKKTRDLFQFSSIPLNFLILFIYFFFLLNQTLIHMVAGANYRRRARDRNKGWFQIISSLPPVLVFIAGNDTDSSALNVLYGTWQTAGKHFLPGQEPYTPSFRLGLLDILWSHAQLGHSLWMLEVWL